MPVHPDTLPDDIDALKALLRQRDGEVQQLRDTVSTLEQALSVRALEIEQLKLQLAKLKRMQFGRKSEKLDRRSSSWKPDWRTCLLRKAQAETARLPPRPRRAREIARQPLPEHLPREDRVLEPPEQACPSCGGELKPLGEDVSEQLDLIDAAFKVIRHIRRKKACACCDVIVQAPRRAGRSSAASPGLGCWPISWFRSSRPSAAVPPVGHLRPCRRGAGPLDDGRWWGLRRAAAPAGGGAARYVLAPGKMHADDTPMPVLAPGNGQTNTDGSGSMCGTTGIRVGSAAGGMVCLLAEPQRPASALPLARFSGVLQADALPVSTRSMPMDASGKRPAWRMRDARFMICMCARRRTTTEALRRTASCTPSRRRSGASRLTSAARYAAAGKATTRQSGIVAARRLLTLSTSRHDQGDQLHA